MSSTKGFKTLISDFCRDLSTTFPEYQLSWSKWIYDSNESESNDSDSEHLFGYMLRIFPERFFDILYKNEAIFAPDSEVDCRFLPDVDFRTLWNLNITSGTKDTIWKYLQLVLFQIMEKVHDLSKMGDQIEGINEEEIQAKITETFATLQDFFSKKTSNTGSESGTESGTESTSNPLQEESSGSQQQQEQSSQSNPFANLFGSDPEKIQEHLKRLMSGKIGGLVKELVDDLKDDMEDMQKELSDKYGIPLEEMNSTNLPMQDIMKELIGNPGKVSKIMHKVSDKLKAHMTPENRQEYVQETMEMLNQMGGKEEFMKMFEQMRSGMGGMFAKGAKGAKVDQNALTRMEKQSAQKNKMRQKVEAKKALKEKEGGGMVFKPDGEEGPARSEVPLTGEQLDQLMKQFGLEEEGTKDTKKKGQAKANANANASK